MSAESALRGAAARIGSEIVNLSELGINEDLIPEELRAAYKTIPVVQRPEGPRKKQRKAEYEARADKLPRLKIKSVKLTMIDPESRFWQNAPIITSHEEKGERGDLADPFMGPSYINNLCSTCNQGIELCPGHEGLIRLKASVYHPTDSACRTIAAVLNSVCNNTECSNLGNLILTSHTIAGIKEKHRDEMSRLEEISVSTKGHQCEVCKRSNTIVYERMKGPDRIYVSYTSPVSGSQVALEPDEAREKLSYVTSDALRLLGLDTHPKLLVLTALPVMPPRHRWPNTQQGGYTAHAITEMYQEVIKANNNLIRFLDNGELPRRKTKKAPVSSEKTAEQNKNELVKILVHRVQHFISNSDGTFKHMREPHVGMGDRLTGKKGLIRGTQRKRTDYFMRSVAGPSPFAPFGWHDVPEETRKKTTFPEIVTSVNYLFIKELHNRGETTKIEYNSGKYQGVIVDITPKNRSSIEIGFGDRVHRYLQHGDWCLVNRQPTLHRYSIMGFRCRFPKDQWGVSPRTSRMNTNTTTPFNADFDGDEINMHVPQSYEARTEVMLLMSATKNMINDQTNINTMGIIYDGVIGAYMMTEPGEMISPKMFYALLEWIEGPEKESLFRRLQKHGVPLYSGKAGFSMCLPIDFNYSKGDVKIRDGVLVAGQIKKAHIGVSDKSIVTMIRRQYGEDRAVRFMTECPRIMYIYLTDRGFSVDLDDCLPKFLPLETRQRISSLESRLRQLETARSEPGNYFAERLAELDTEIAKLGSVGFKETLDPFTFDAATHEIKTEKQQAEASAAKARLAELRKKRAELVNLTRSESSALEKIEAEISEVQVELDSIDRDPISAQAELLNRYAQEVKVKVVALTQAKEQAVSEIERERYEQLIKVTLNNTATIANEIMRNTVDGTNRIVVGIKSGGKGSEMNLSQIIGRVNQQFYRGDRLTPSPYHTLDDPDPIARGLCVNSWITGMTPPEYYSIHVAGREGLTDTSTKTSETGYSQRQMMNIGENFETTPDGTVRNQTTGRIICYSYGTDNHAGSKRLKMKGEYDDRADFTDFHHFAENENARSGYAVTAW